jgi:hypothetical protein
VARGLAGSDRVVEFREIALSDDGQGLSFEVWRPDTAGPIEYSLTRV